MVHVYCDKRGAGKTKALINMANGKAMETKGDVIYIDDDNGPCYSLDRRIRLVTTETYDTMDCDIFYGFLCGIISENYDIDTIYIDGLFNIVKSNLKDSAHLFLRMENLSLKTGIDFFINVNGSRSEIPDYLYKYVTGYAYA